MEKKTPKQFQMKKKKMCARWASESEVFEFFSGLYDMVFIF